MSRYEIPCKDPNLNCVIGWNDRFGTFYAKIRYITDKSEDKLTACPSGGETTSIAVLQDNIADFLIIPEDIVQKLQEDYNNRGPEISPEQKDAEWLNQLRSLIPGCNPLPADSITL